MTADAIAEPELSEVEIAPPENDPADKRQLNRVARPIAWNRKLDLQLLRKEAETLLETKAK